MISMFNGRRRALGQISGSTVFAQVSLDDWRSGPTDWRSSTMYVKAQWRSGRAGPVASTRYIRRLV